jgi:hypothetical protein
MFQNWVGMLKWEGWAPMLMMMTLPIHLWYLIMHSYASIELIVNDALTSQIGKGIRWITPELN